MGSLGHLAKRHWLLGQGQSGYAEWKSQGEEVNFPSFNKIFFATLKTSFGFTLQTYTVLFFYRQGAKKIRRQKYQHYVSQSPVFSSVKRQGHSSSVSVLVQDCKTDYCQRKKKLYIADSSQLYLR